MDKIRFFDRKLLVMSLCAGIALASVAFADDAANDPVATRMKAMDTNLDGMVSKDEYMTYAKSRFDAMDTDHDGQVTTTEMDASRKDAMKGKTVAAQRVSSATAIKLMDANNDGMLSAEEHATAAEKEFNAMDTNHDDQLSMDEMRIGRDAQIALGDVPAGT